MSRPQTINVALSRKPTRVQRPVAIWGSDDGGCDDESASVGKKSVNMKLKEQQKAIRRAAVTNSTEYDFDGTYEQFQQKQKDDELSSSKSRESRYMQKLMETSAHRRKWNEVTLERKIAREQQLEGDSAQYMGKEKFITASYRDRLAERASFLKQEHMREQNEVNDHRGKTDGTAMMMFYGNLASNFEKGDHMVQSQGSHEARVARTDTNGTEHSGIEHSHVHIVSRVEDLSVRVSQARGRYFKRKHAST